MGLNYQMDQNRDSKHSQKIKAPFKLWAAVGGFVLLIIITGWIGLASGCYGNDGAGDTRRDPLESTPTTAGVTFRE